MKWIRAHIHPLILALGAIAVAVKPEITGSAQYHLTDWLGVGLIAAGAVNSYITPVLNVSSARWAKDTTSLLAAGFGAAITVAPNGLSRGELWTIGAAVVTVGVPLVFPTTTQQAILVGPGQMGDGGNPNT